MARIKPGDLCLIVGELPTCECNIGATLTVIDFLSMDGVPGWTFKDASRPLKIIDNTVLPVGFVSASSEIPYIDVVVWDQFLVPIRDPDTETEQEKEKEYEPHT